MAEALVVLLVEVLLGRAAEPRRDERDALARAAVRQPEQLVVAGIALAREDRQIVRVEPGGA